MRIEKFEDMIAWQKSRILTKIIYEITGKNIFSKDYGFKDQIRRACVSITSNIAEGFDRQGDLEFKKFLYYAKGSCAEVRSQLYTALDLQYITQEEFNELSELCIEINKMLSKFISYLRKQ